MGDIDGPFYDGEGDLRKEIVQMRHKRAGETKMMARYGTFACIVIVVRHIPDICHESHENSCVNFFWPV